MTTDARARRDAIAAVGVVATTALGIAFWPLLPEQVAIHVSATGEPDSAVSRPVAVLAIPALMLVTYGTLRWSFRTDPPAVDRVATVTTVSVLGLCGALQVLVLAWNVGVPVPFDLVLVGVAVWAVALVGYVRQRERTAA